MKKNNNTVMIPCLNKCHDPIYEISYLYDISLESAAIVFAFTFITFLEMWK